MNYMKEVVVDEFSDILTFMVPGRVQRKRVCVCWREGGNMVGWRMETKASPARGDG